MKSPIYKLLAISNDPKRCPEGQDRTPARAQTLRSRNWSAGETDIRMNLIRQAAERLHVGAIIGVGALLIGTVLLGFIGMPLTLAAAFTIGNDVAEWVAGVIYVTLVVGALGHLRMAGDDQ